MAFTAATGGLAAAAVAAVGRVIDATVRTLTAAWAAAWDAVASGFTAALEGLLAGAEQWPARAQINRDPGVQRALSNAGRVLRILSGLAASETTAAARTLAGNTGREQAAIIASQLPPGRAAPARPGGSHQRAVATIVTRAGQRITALTRPLAADAERAMRRELVRGVLLGANPRESAARMVRQVEGAFNGGLSRALTIARTETLDAYRQAAAAAQDEHRDVLTGWVWLAHLNGGSSCPACWAMHGSEHPLSEPGPQGHPNCRCSRAPKARSWRDLGFDLDEPADQIPNAQAAFAALPRDQQLRIMGAARLALLDSGAITWRDLAERRDNPGWRPSYAPVPLTDLRQPAGA
jgi:F like protein